LPSQYKIEIFDRDYNFRDKAVFGDTPFLFDYLTLENTELKLPRLNAVKGDYAHVTDFSGNIVYQGFIADASFDKRTSRFKLAPLLSLFDVTVIVDKAYLETGSLEGLIEQAITDNFISNADSLQNIEGLSVTALTNTYGVALDIDKSVVELYDIITSALSQYGIVVKATLNPQAHELNVTIGAASATPVTIETTLLNAIDKNFVIGDSYGAVNKLTLVNQNDETERKIYYLHSDGTVSDTDEDRIYPVFPKTEYINNTDFASAAENRAKKVLSPQKFNNQIELTYSRSDKLISGSCCDIGTVVKIIDGADVYGSILTGYEKTEDLIKLVFGIVREDLTKKLILEGRRRGVSAYASAEQGILIESAYKSALWAIARQVNGTNSDVNSQGEIWGLGWIQGNGARELTATVYFDPVTHGDYFEDDFVFVEAEAIGACATTKDGQPFTPSKPSDFDVNSGFTTAKAQLSTRASFQAHVSKYSNDGSAPANFLNTYYYGFKWRAVGKKSR
jgi:hypothetical protein